MAKVNLTIDDWSLDFDDEEIYRLAMCLKYAKKKSKERLDEIKNLGLFEPDEKSVCYDVDCFANKILKRL